ncbi:MAG TPA: glycosyltransferase family 4 protein [Candidatus Paceibacterota bacterium]|nr:glycosyltransferase family 4 protein [Candidatus Paceibacterota bacterium]
MDAEKTMILFVVNARMPNKKAYGIQIGKMCEAFIENGEKLELIIPRTQTSSTASLRELYNLRVEIPTTILPGLDWYARGRFAFALSSLIFILSSAVYLLGKRLTGARAIIYTVDMDTFSFAPLVFFGFPCIAEMHDVKPVRFFTKQFFKRAKLIVATNTEIAQTLGTDFSIESARMIIEPNGVDMQRFDSDLSREEARRRLGISSHKKIALYAGRFYAWKGLGILIKASEALPQDVECYAVGGSKEDFLASSSSREIPDQLHIAGSYPLTEMPLWHRTADVLLVIGTRDNARSFRHTSPMKVFEYMASHRPLVAADTPALRSIIEAGEALWYAPDTPEDLARAIADALSSDTSAIVARAYERAKRHTWQLRAARIYEKIIAL